ncbi:MAG: hypothetical protein CME64_14900 [Halobacteriovoraceae bacterium]|nr:hypothetical protein [Halobacteriovoraceae bacterium]|tara:strand:+ start:25170 stop:26360 length:1191 start_codon:yes stop_codon:yes gene_type:complete
MEVSIINIVFFLNCVLAAILRNYKKAVGLLIAMVSLLFVLIYFGFIGWQDNSSLLLASGVGFFYLLHEFLKKEAGVQRELSIFFGFFPLLLVTSSNLLTFSVFLFIFEAFKALTWWNSKGDEAKWLQRLQYVDSLKFFVIFISLFFAMVSFDQIEIPSRVLPDKTTLVVLGTWFFLGTLYLGVVDSIKDMKRKIHKSHESNPNLFIVLSHCFIPLLVMVRVHGLMENMDFDLYQDGLRLTSVLVFMTILNVILGLKERNSKYIEYYKIIFLLTTLLFLFLGDFSIVMFMTLNLFCSSFAYILEVKDTPKLKQLGGFLLTPSPYSPIYIFIVFHAFNYEGPLNIWLRAVILAGLLLGYNLKGKQTGSLLMTRNSSDLLPVAGLALFVSILFIAKIAL